MVCLMLKLYTFYNNIDEFLNNISININGTDIPKLECVKYLALFTDLCMN